MSFQITPIARTEFEQLLDLTEAELSEFGAEIVIADGPGYPCRLSLEEAKEGETLILTNYVHQSAQTPYRSSHAVFIRKNATEVSLQPGEVPDLLKKRLISLRGFSKDHYLKTGDVADGQKLGQAINNMFANSEVDYIHLHNAKEGCYHASARRV